MSQAPRPSEATPPPVAGPPRRPGVILNGPDVPTRRVLLVGDESRLASLRRGLGQADIGVQVATAGDYLAALGVIPGVAPDLVIGPLDGLEPMRDSIIAGLRRLAPKAQLAVVAPAVHRQQADRALEAGVDRCLIEPVTPADLTNLLGATPPASSHQAPAAPPPAALPTEQAPHPLSDPLGKLGSDDADLGDVDLIEQLLQDPARLVDTAMRLMITQSRITGLGFATQADRIPPGRLHVPVEYRGQPLGLLYAAPPVTADVLKPWASWLAHWLALEKKHEALWEMAARDELTGAYNRRYFDRYLARLLARAAARRMPVTLLVFDIDNFKTYNDRYGHAAGDEILKQTIRLMRSAVREHDVVARIGGDEFAVIFWDAAGPRRPNSSHPDDVKKAAQRFQHSICQHHFPKLYDQAPGTLTISGGLASYPWDGSTPAALLERADAMLLHSKRQGKNAITFGPGAARACEIQPGSAPE